MATYSSYKKVFSENIVDGSIPQASISDSTLNTWCVKWVYGNPSECSAGCCCRWTVPTYVTRLYFELWGAGGNGSGSCGCCRCHHHAGAGGGYFAAKSISTSPGCVYTVCAGGVYRCRSRECYGCNGCASYVCGHNLSNFCAIGGGCGQANGAWSTACFSDFSCALAPTSNGSDFTMGNHPGGFDNNGMGICHCWCRQNRPTAAPFIGTLVGQGLNCCAFRCGCWTVPYGHGGQSAMHGCCGSSTCGQGGTGGPGLVKIAFL